HLQVLDVVGVDLIEAAVMPRLVSPMVGQPVGGILVCVDEPLRVDIGCACRQRARSERRRREQRCKTKIAFHDLPPDIVVLYGAKPVYAAGLRVTSTECWRTC